MDDFLKNIFMEFLNYFACSVWLHDVMMALRPEIRSLALFVRSHANKSKLINRTLSIRVIKYYCL